MNILKRLIVQTTILIFSLFSTLSLTAQVGWEVGPWLGVSYYLGDLNTNFDFSTPGIAGGLAARYNFNERLCMKFSGNYGKVMADDANSSNVYERLRNLSFESVIVDGSAQFEFNFLPYVHGSSEYFFTPYLFGGISVFYFNPKAELDGTYYELRELGTEGQFKGEEYYSVTGAVNYGLGLKLDLSYRWSLNFEIGARATFTDYLDDVSTVYPDKDDLMRMRDPIALELSDRSIIEPGLNDGQLSEEGRQRGNSGNKDSYIFAGIGILYYFGDLKCPELSRPGGRRR